MADVTVRVRDNGPLLIEGAFVMTDGENKDHALPANKPAIALCRCGASQNKPFCDGAHKAAGFQSSVRSPS